MNPIDVVRAMDEFDAFLLLCDMRWPENDGIPVCPACAYQKPPMIINRKNGAKLFKCKDCGHQFTPTSGTIFAGHKLAIKTLLVARLLWEESGGKIAANALARGLGLNWRTAYVLCGKFAESGAMRGGPLSEAALLWRGYWQYGQFRLEGEQLQRQHLRSRKWHDVI